MDNEEYIDCFIEAFKEHPSLGVWAAQIMLRSEAYSEAKQRLREQPEFNERYQDVIEKGIALESLMFIPVDAVRRYYGETND